MLSYEVMTEEEALKEKFQLLPDGEYQALVDRAILKTSSRGNQMIQLELSVYDNNGKPTPVYDYLVLTKNMMWKIIHFCQSSGLEEEYKNKTLSHKIMEGKNIIIKIVTKKGNEIPENKLNGKTIGSKYPDKNSVEDYIVINKEKSNSSNEYPFNDDLPF